VLSQNHRATKLNKSMTSHPPRGKASLNGKKGGGNRPECEIGHQKIQEVPANAPAEFLPCRRFYALSCPRAERASASQGDEVRGSTKPNYMVSKACAEPAEVSNHPNRAGLGIEDSQGCARDNCRIISSQEHSNARNQPLLRDYYSNVFQ